MQTQRCQVGEHGVVVTDFGGKGPCLPRLDVEYLLVPSGREDAVTRLQPVCSVADGDDAAYVVVAEPDGVPGGSDCVAGAGIGSTACLTPPGALIEVRERVPHLLRHPLTSVEAKLGARADQARRRGNPDCAGLGPGLAVDACPTGSAGCPRPVACHCGRRPQGVYSAPNDADTSMVLLTSLNGQTVTRPTRLRPGLPEPGDKRAVTGMLPPATDPRVPPGNEAGQNAGSIRFADEGRAGPAAGWPAGGGVSRCLVGVNLKGTVRAIQASLLVLTAWARRVHRNDVDDGQDTGWAHGGATRAAASGLVRTAAIELAADGCTTATTMPATMVTGDSMRRGSHTRS